MEFEFDPHKNAANRVKHGIDFVQAQHLWKDSNRVVIPARTVDEERYMLLAMYKGKHWSALYAKRGDRIRLISVRRSREEERVLYEGQASR